jgi:hypothetical protein
MILQERTSNNLTGIRESLKQTRIRAKRTDFKQSKITSIGDSTDYNIPLIAVKPELNSVADYFGLPLGKTMNVSALPFREPCDRLKLERSILALGTLSKS